MKKETFISRHCYLLCTNSTHHLCVICRCCFARPWCEYIGCPLVD